jgi:putative flippase GtrA
LDRPAAARSTAPAADGPSRKGSFGRFLAVGGTATVVQYALLALLVDGAGWVPALASACAYAVAMMLNYELTRRFTFHGRAGSWRLFGRFLTVQVAGLALNTAIFEAGLRLGLPHYLLAQLVATAVVTVVSWNAYRRWAFRH